MPNVRHVMGRLSSCNSGLMLMSMSDSARPVMATAIQLSVVPSTAMPGTSHTAAPTATAVTSQRMMNCMASPFSAAVHGLRRFAFDYSLALCAGRVQRRTVTPRRAT